MNIEVGSYEAKTRLPELLRGIQAGNRYTITLRGQAIASLVPAENNKNADAAAVVAEMRALMDAAATTMVESLDLKALIEDGRA